MYLGKGIIREYLRRSLYTHAEPSLKRKVQVLTDFREGFTPTKGVLSRVTRLPVRPRGVLGC